ncbi:MAG: 5'-methylthioadenosine/adenosylhomocysteine nucleosidase [Candidatus Kapaibacterium sp.]
MPIGIMSAMHEEIHLLHEQMEVESEVILGMRTYFVGKLYGNEVVVVFSRWGKVAAASTATALIVEFGVDEIIFSGVAGGLDKRLNIGDIVIGESLIQHDMDATPIFSKFEIPLMDKTYFDADTGISQQLTKATENFLANNKLESKLVEEFGLYSPTIYHGDIASGDRFISDSAEIERFRTELPEVLCVEMEGAAAGQICYEYGIPFGIVRTISDSANDDAHIDFIRFVNKVASHYTSGIIERYLGLGFDSLVEQP